MSSSNKGEGIRIQRCMRIVGCAGPLQKGHRSTRSTHAPQTAWPQSTNATDFEAAQHSAHWDASSPQRARSSTGRAAATRRPSARCAARHRSPWPSWTAATPSAARASSASTGALFVEGRRRRRSAYTSEIRIPLPLLLLDIRSTLHILEKSASMSHHASPGLLVP